MSHVHLLLLSATLCTPLLAQASEPPVLKPVKLTTDAAKAAKPAADAHGAHSAAAEPASAAWPMQRWRACWRRW